MATGRPPRSVQVVIDPTRLWWTTTRPFCRPLTALTLLPLCSVATHPLPRPQAPGTPPPPWLQHSPPHTHTEHTLPHGPWPLPPHSSWFNCPPRPAAAQEPPSMLPLTVTHPGRLFTAPHGHPSLRRGAQGCCGHASTRPSTDGGGHRQRATSGRCQTPGLSPAGHTGWAATTAHADPHPPGCHSTASPEPIHLGCPTPAHPPGCCTPPTCHPRPVSCRDGIHTQLHRH